MADEADDPARREGAREGDDFREADRAAAIDVARGQERDAGEGKDEPGATGAREMLAEE